MKPINIEKLMNHSIGISNSYYRATENDILEDYLKVVDFLTISKENRIIIENQQMKIHNESLQREKDELNLLRKQLAPLLELKRYFDKRGNITRRTVIVMNTNGRTTLKLYFYIYIRLLVSSSRQTLFIFSNANL